MAFLPYKFDGSIRPQSIQYLPGSAFTPKVGMALKYNSGKLALCSGTTKPEYISLVEKSAALSAGDVIPVLRIHPDMIFAVPAQADASAVADGSKVTIHTDGLQVTATTTSGVAEIVGREGTGAAGDILYVRIV